MERQIRDGVVGSADNEKEMVEKEGFVNADMIESDKEIIRELTKRIQIYLRAFDFIREMQKH